jgi:hypothetical protein
VNVERQLGAIKTKADLHAWVDALDFENPDVRGIMFVGQPTENDECIRYREIGDMDLATVLYYKPQAPSFLERTLTMSAILLILAIVFAVFSLVGAIVGTPPYLRGAFVLLALSVICIILHLLGVHA